MTKRSPARSAGIAVGCGLAAVAAVVAVAVPLGAPDDPTRPAAAGVGVQLTGSDDDRADDSDDDGEESVARTSDGVAFELEIDPELDARFGPRPVNGVRAAEIATARFGGTVVAAELDEDGGRPIWEVELAGAAVDEVDVDAIDGRIR